MKRTFLSVLVFALIPALSYAQPSPRGSRSRPNDGLSFKENPKMLAAFREVVKGPAASVVRIVCDSKEVALGTVVDAEGRVLTKYSELLPDVAPSIRLADGRSFEAAVVGGDKKLDLVMLKPRSATGVTWTPVRWGKSAEAVVGTLLAAPGTGADPIAVGVVSVAARAVKPTDLPPSTPPANSGFLGVGLEEAEGGAKITNVMPDTAAAKAGLKVGDIVTRIADTPIIDSETMINTIQQHKPGDVVRVKARRGHEEIGVDVTLGKRPADPRMERRDYQNRLGSELSNRRGGFPAILQHDMVIKPGDCGGPVVDLDGKAVGLNIARAGRVESYALPTDVVLKAIEEFKTPAKPTAATPATDKPATDKATAAKPAGAKPAVEKPAADKPTGAKPAGVKPTAAR